MIWDRRCEPKAKDNYKRFSLSMTVERRVMAAVRHGRCAVHCRSPAFGTCSPRFLNSSPTMRMLSSTAGYPR